MSFHARLSALNEGQLRDVVERVGLERDTSQRHTPRDLTTQLVKWTAWPDVDEAERRARRLAAAIAAVCGEALDPWPDWVAWAQEEHGTIALIGGDDRAHQAIPVADLFVPLNLLDRAQGRFYDHRREGPAEDDGLATLADVCAAIETKVGRRETVRGAVLIGAPGCGKTTLLRHALLETLTQGSESLGLIAGLRPILLRFSRLFDCPDWNSPGGLSRVVRHQCAADGHPDVASHILAEKRVLFLLDGLDEVRDDAARKEIAAWLSAEVAHWSNSRFLATCRSQAWDRSTIDLGRRFWSFDVMPLEEPGIRGLIDRWYSAVTSAESHLPSAVKSAPARARAKRDDLLARLFDTDWMVDAERRRLASNPLLLSTICDVHKQRGDLPRRRVELYDHLLRLMLHRWSDHSGRGRGVPDLDGRLLLAPLAWKQQLAAGGPGELREITRDDALAVLAARLPDLKESGDLTPDEALRRLSYDCGVLVETDIGRFQFAHLTLQEYLAAWHADWQRDAGLLAERLGDDRFAEPILLAMAKGTLFVPFFRAALAREDVVDHLALLVRCIDEAALVEAAPFVEVLEQDEPGVGGVAALRLFVVGKKHEAVVAAAERLVDHRDDAVCDAARTMLGRPVRARCIAVAPTSGPAGAMTLAGLLALPRPPPPVVPRDLDLPLVWVPAGEGWMGATSEPGAVGFDGEASGAEGPVARVRLSQGFWLGMHPVTHALYARFVQETEAPSAPTAASARFHDPRQPVTGVSWTRAQEFCDWLSRRVGATVTLPTEAQWEWAARGPDGRRYPWGGAEPDLGRAVYGQPFEKGAPGRVGERAAGAGPFGAHDQAGNVWEWCVDTYVDRLPIPEQLGDILVDPCRNANTPEGAPRVLRGGCWLSDSKSLRCSSRGRMHPSHGDRSVGFRVCVWPAGEWR